MRAPKDCFRTPGGRTSGRRPARTPPVGVAIARPGDHAVGPDEHGAQAEVVPCRPGRVPHPARPAQRRIAQAPVAGEVEDDAEPVAHQLAEAGAVLKAEVRGVAAGQRLVAAEVVADRRARGPAEHVRRSVAGPDQVADHRLDRLGVRVRLHDRRLGARPVESLGAERTALVGVGVEQPVRRVPAHGRGELPAQVHGVADAEVESLRPEGGVDVGGVAREQDASLPVGRRLHRPVGEAGGETDVVERHVGAGHAAQNRLEVVAGRRPRAVERAAVELHHAEVLRRGRAQVHARRRQVEAGTQLLGIGDGGERDVPGEQRLGADEAETRQAAHRAAPAVAADEPARGVLVVAGARDHALVARRDGRDRDAAPDLHAERGRPLRQHRLDSFQARHHALRRRAGQPERQGRDVDGGRVEHHAGEVAPATRGRRLVRAGMAGMAGMVVGARRLQQRVQHPAAVERLHRGHGQAPHPERVRLRRGAGLGVPLQHQDRAAREAELAGQEQTDRARPHYHHVMHENFPSEASRPVVSRGGTFSFGTPSLKGAAHTGRTRR
ncbi:hypothetical protein GCM10010149_89470 [Nonomuraea roseoviolacea subsp. roseoviolacea]